MKHRQEMSSKLILLLQGVGLLLSFISIFLGALYAFSGSILIAAVTSLFFVVVMYYLITYFIKEKLKRKRKGYPNQTILLFTVYGLLSIVASFFVLHFINVEFMEREEIQRVGTQKIKGLELFYKQYDDISTRFCNSTASSIQGCLMGKSTLSNIDQACLSYLKSNPVNLDSALIVLFLSDPANMTTQIEEFKIRALRDQFGNYKSQLLKDSTDFIAKRNDIISQWSRLKIAGTMDDLTERIVNDHAALTKFLQEKNVQNGQLPPQTPYLEETLMDKPIDLASKHLGAVSFIVLFFFQFLILLPFFMTRGRTFGSGS